MKINRKYAVRTKTWFNSKSETEKISIISLNDNHISDRKGDTRFAKLLNESEIEMLKKEHKLNEIINYFYPSPSPEHPYGWNGDERNKKRSF